MFKNIKLPIFYISKRNKIFQFHISVLEDVKKNHHIQGIFDYMGTKYHKCGACDFIEKNVSKFDKTDFAKMCL